MGFDLTGGGLELARPRQLPIARADITRVPFLADTFDLVTAFDVLACLEPCREPPFRAIAPPLFERLQRVTTLVAVLQDWDDSREALLRQVHALGTAVHVIVVHDGPTTRPLAGAAAELGPLELLSPQEVERRLALEKARPDPAARPVEVVHA